MGLLGDRSTHVVECLDIGVLSSYYNFLLLGLSAIFKFIWILNTLCIFLGLVIALRIQQWIWRICALFLIWVVNAVWVSACYHTIDGGERHGDVEPLYVFLVPWVLDYMKIQRTFWASLDTMGLYTVVLWPSWNRAFWGVLYISKIDPILINVVWGRFVPPTVLIGWDISICMDWSDIHWCTLFIFQ